MKTVKYFDTEKVCGNCTHFYQHFVHNEVGIYEYTAINAGHCGHPRYKDRTPLHEGCIYWEKRES